MTTAVPRHAGSPVVVSGLASTAVRDLVSGPGRPGTVLGSSTYAVWLGVGGRVLVISTADATRLPNGVEIPHRSSQMAFEGVRHGEAAVIGSGRAAVGGLIVDAVRWWDPRPALARIGPVDLASAIEGLPASVRDLDEQPLARALSVGSPDAIVAAASGLIGLGPGLTPEGDDLVAGVLAGLRTLGDALGSDPARRLLDGAAHSIIDLAGSRTTGFSADLIRCAASGRVAAPAGSFLRALTGRGDVAYSHAALLAVGHTSGSALAAGIVLGARYLTAITRDPLEVTCGLSG